MSEPVDIRMEDWNRLQREVTRLRTLVIVALLSIIALAAVSLLRKSPVLTRPGAILRAQGLVITDTHGRDRILIGAPVPASKDRLRKDDASNGIIFLGDTGSDRLALGQLPALRVNGKTYKRRGDGDNYGVTLYDGKGNERGGMAFMGSGRVGIALDRGKPPYEAIGLMVDDSQDSAGVYVNYGDPKARGPAFELGSDASSVHLQLGGKDGLPRAMLKVDGAAKPTWKFADGGSTEEVPQSP